MNLNRANRIGALTLLSGTLITTFGISWDIQWHSDVGPDTFFTLPHLLLYSGSAIAGVASLVMVLLVTARQRAGDTIGPEIGGTPVRVLGGRFHAPLGYLVAGCGAASFLGYGLLDLWWHSLYGFDAVLNSPPHVALFLSISVTMVGSIVVFAAGRAARWGAAGLLAAVPVLITFSPVTTEAFSPLPAPFDPVLAGTVLFAIMLVVTGGLALRRTGGMLAVAGVLAALQAVLWVFSPWAAHAYAAATGLPLRDSLTAEPPELPGSIPMFLIVSALVLEAGLRLGRVRGWDQRLTLPVTGALAGALLAAGLCLQIALTDPSDHRPAGQVVTLTVAGFTIGALATFLGTRFATLLRMSAPSERLA